jgi:hypothetical protein
LIEAFVRAQPPDVQRIEICHVDDRIVAHRGCDPVAEGYIAGDGDRAVVLDWTNAAESSVPAPPA